jgi:hypothetical protein
MRRIAVAEAQAGYTHRDARTNREMQLQSFFEDLIVFFFSTVCLEIVILTELWTPTSRVLHRGDVDGDVLLLLLLLLSLTTVPYTRSFSWTADRCRINNENGDGIQSEVERS